MLRNAARLAGLTIAGLALVLTASACGSSEEQPHAVVIYKTYFPAFEEQPTVGPSCGPDGTRPCYKRLECRQVAYQAFAAKGWGPEGGFPVEEGDPVPSGNWTDRLCVDEAEWNSTQVGDAYPWEKVNASFFGS